MTQVPMTESEFDTSRNVTEGEIGQWAAMRADDAGFIARKLITERQRCADLLKALGDCRSSICGYSLSGSPKQAEEAVASMFAEIERIDRVARAALSAPHLAGWRPISEADQGIAHILDAAGLHIGNSLPIWARDSDGRVFECLWADDGKRAYWWDIEGESPVDPVEFMPHPLATI